MDQRDKLDKQLKRFKSEYLKYEGNFIFRATQTLGKNTFDHRLMKDECQRIADIIDKICKQQTVRVKGNYTQNSVFESYISDVVTTFKLGFKKIKGIVKKFIEQRLANISNKRRIDNFRYICEIGTGTASPMLTPYGFITDKEEYKGKFFQIDRSTLEECVSRNLLSHLSLEETPFNNENEFNLYKKKVKQDTITKAELMTVYEEFKDLLDDDVAISDFWKNLMEKLEDESANSEWTFWDLIKDDKFVVNSLKTGLRQFEIIIGRYSVVSRELEKINNKGNGWVDINFEFRKLWNKIGFSMVRLIQDIQKDVEKSLTLLMPSFLDKPKSFGKLLDKAPEYMLLPHLCYHMWSKKGFSYNKVISDESKTNWHEFVEFLEGKQIHKVTEHYSKTGIDESKIESELKLDLIANLYKVDISVWEDKLKDLKKHIDINKTPDFHGAGAKIDQIRNETYGTNPLLMHSILQAIRLPNGSKMLLNKDNVGKIVNMYFKSHFGDHIFTVDNINQTYKIKDPEFEKYLTSKDQGGYPNSHAGRAMLFLNKTRYEMFKSYYDVEFNSEPNVKWANAEISAMKEVTKLSELTWYENGKDGKPVACGYNQDGKLPDVSAEHLQNDTNKVRVLRNINPNSAEGRINKTITKESQWYRFMANNQDKYKDRHGHSLSMVVYGLNAYADFLESEDR